MGDANQLTFARTHRDLFRPPYLEVGSRDYGSTQDLRAVVAPGDYVGVDLVGGQGVDVVADLTADFPTVDETLGGRRFGTVFCLSVLEHCADPAAMGRNLVRLLRPGGVAYVSVPWCWKFHAYPSDYWRFTPRGVRVLLEGLSFDAARCALSTDLDGDLRPIDAELGRITFRPGDRLRRGRILAAVGLLLAKLGRPVGLVRGPLLHRYVFPPAMLHMIGAKINPGSDGEGPASFGPGTRRETP